MRATNPAGPATIRVLLADDHAVLRQALRLLLDARPEISVVGEAGDGREAIDLAESLRPQVVLLDITMPDLNGIEVARHISRTLPGTRIIMLSASGTRELVVEALRAGALGFVIKRSNIDELLLAVRLVVQGQHYFSADLAESFDLGDLIYEAKLPPGESPAGALTEREREIVSLLVEGYTTRAIAEKLVLSEKTVDGHKTHAMAKLGVHDRASLVKAAIQQGLVTLE